MPKLICMVGVSGSGKTTKAKEMVVKDNNNNSVIVCRDDIRRMLFGLEKKVDYKFTKAREKLVKDVQYRAVIEALVNNKNVIIADVNISPRTRNRWKQFCKQYKVPYEEEILWDSSDLDLMQKRNALREDSIPPKAVAKQWLDFRTHISGEPMQDLDPSLRDCIIVDIDGTMAHMGDRSPYDWAKVYEDEMDYDVVSYINHASEYANIIVFSGRDGSCYEETQQWLIDNQIEHHELHMREEGDTRKDSIIKVELYEKYVKGKYNVLHVIDDRPQVVDTWWDLGLKVWAVADQRVKF